MTGPTCALPGCCKSASAPVRQGDAPPLACGILHHQLLMACRFNHPALPHPHLAILRRNDAGLCALLSCEEPPSVGHSWCSYTHYLQWLAEFTRSGLHPAQICMLDGCTRHVYVDENGSASQFCGRRHQQDFVTLLALKHHQQQVEVTLQQPPSPASASESEWGRLPSQLMESLEQVPVCEISPKNIRVVEDFYEKHPWEVFTGRRSCWLFVRLKFTSTGTRQLITTGHYHWKQSSGPTGKSIYTEKYYTYREMEGKKRETDQQHAEGSYRMKEYTIQDVEWALIHLVEAKPFSDGKLGKEQPRKRQNTGQVDNACSQDAVTSCPWGDDDNMLVDRFLNDLPGPDEDASRFSEVS